MSDGSRSTLGPCEYFTGTIDFLPLLKEGDSYGSRRRAFCFIADFPPCRAGPVGVAPDR